MNTQKKGISIIVPVYNAEKYLEACINSVLGQTFSEFELILVNDGSQDTSPEICEAFALKDKRIRVVHQGNQGVSAARNAGLKEAAGDYIMFVDSDDWLDETYLEDFQKYIESNCDIVIGGFTKYKDNGIQDKVSMHVDLQSVESMEDSILSQMIKRGLLNSCWGKLFRSDLAKSHLFPLGSAWGEDTAFVLSCIAKDSIIACCKTEKYYYRCSETGLDKRFDLNKPNYMQRYYKELLSFCDRISTGEPGLKESIEIKVSQEFLRTILALKGQKKTWKEERFYLNSLFANREVNNYFRTGCLIDNNPWVIKGLSYFTTPLIWQLFLRLKS